MMLEVIAAALVGASRRVAGAPAAGGSGATRRAGVRAARSRGNAQGRGPGGAQGDRVRPGDGQAVGRGLRLPQAQVHGGGARCAPGGERGSVRAGRGRRWRCRGHDRCQGSSPSLRRDFGAARRAGLPDMWSASGAGRGVLLLLRAPPPAGRCLRRLRRRARPRQPVLRPNAAAAWRRNLAQPHRRYCRLAAASRRQSARGSSGGSRSSAPNGRGRNRAAEASRAGPMPAERHLQTDRRAVTPTVQCEPMSGSFQTSISGPAKTRSNPSGPSRDSGTEISGRQP